MKKTKPPKSDDPEQSKRFIETAEKHGADDNEALERAFKKIISSPQRADRFVKSVPVAVVTTTRRKK